MVARFLVRFGLAFSAGLLLAACSASKHIEGSVGNYDSTTVSLTPLTITKGQTGQAVITLSEPASTDVVVNYSTADGSAIAGTDYTSLTGSMTIAAGQTSASVTLTALQDNIYTGNLDFNFNLATPTNGIGLSGGDQVTILDNDSKPTVQFSAATSNGPDSTTPHLITVTLSDESAFVTMVDFGITGGTAIAGTDYTLSPGVVTFAPHVISQTISVGVIDTHLYQPDKTIDLDLTSPSGATLGAQATHVHTINETAAEPSLSINNVTANAGTTPNFVVTLSAASGVATTFNYATANVTASAGTDYTSSSGTATIAAGATTYTLPVSTALSSGGKSFTMGLSGIVNATGATTTGTATMILVPTISVNNVTANAGTNVSFVVTLSGATTQNITFDYASADGTAHQPGDYTSSSGSATIIAGATTLTLPAITTQVSSGGKNFTMSLSSFVNAVAGTTTGTATMVVMPTISIANVMQTAGVPVNFIVSLSTPSSQNITFSYATADGTATAPADYSSASGTATITAGQTTLTLPAVTTLAAGAGDNFTMNVTSVVNALPAAGVTGTATLTSQPVININNILVTAGNAATFTVTLSAAATGDVTFNYATSDGTGTQPTDYTSESGSATLTAGQTSLTLPGVTTFAAGGGLNFNMTLSSVSGAVNGVVSGVATLNPPFTWLGTAGDGLWSNSANWSSNAVPGAANVATFNGSCSGANCNVTIDAAESVGGVNITSAYTGTITQGAFDLNVGSSGWVQASGTFTGKTITNSVLISGAFSQTGGTFTGGNVTSFGGNVTSSAGTLSANGGFTFIASSAPSTVNVNGANLGQIQFNNLLGGDVTITGTVNATSVELDNGAAAPGGGGNILGGTIINSGDLKAKACCLAPGGTTVIEMAGTSARTITGVAGSYFPSIQINSTSTVTLAGTIDVAGNWTYTAGTVAAGTSTVEMVGATAATITDSFTNFNNFNFAKSIGNLTLGSDLNISANFSKAAPAGASGPSITGAHNINVKGNVTTTSAGGGTYAASSQPTIQIIGTSGTQTISTASGVSLENLTINSASTVVFSGTVYLSHNLTYTAATSVTVTGSTLYFQDGPSAINTNAFGANWNNVTFSPTNNTTTFTGSFNIAGAGLLSCASGSCAYNGGTIGAHAGLTLNGAGVTGGTTAITFNGAGAKTMTQTAGSWPTGGVSITNSAGSLTLGSAINLNTQTLAFNANTTLYMAGFNLTGISTLAMQAGSSIYKDCATLTYTTLSPALGNIYGGASGASIAIANAANVNEGQPQYFVVTDAVADCQADTFTFATADGTALAGTNYTSASGTATIAAGQTTTTITVTTLNNGEYGPNVNYTATISAPTSGVVLGTATGTGTIVNINAQPTINIGNVTTNAGSTANFVVTLTTASMLPVTFSFATSDGTAAAGTDYTSSSGSATIATGATTYTLPVTTAFSGGGKNFNMALSSIVGATAGTTSGVATLNAVAPTQIYRSVGPSNTTPLACGATGNGAGCSNLGNVTIAGTMATFASALPNNIGVGDAIQYQVAATWYIAFVVGGGRTSSTVYTLQNATGGAPQAAGANTTWSIFRAYKKSLNAWGGSTWPAGNSAINGAVRNFDPATSQNLVANNTKYIFAQYADANEAITSGLGTAAFTTSPTNNVRVYSPYASTDVGVSQRHNGTWTTSGYMMTLTTATGAFVLASDGINISFDGLQFAQVVTGSDGGSSWEFLHTFHTGSATVIQISNNLIKMTATASAPTCSGFNLQNVAGDVFNIWNNVIYSDGIACAGGGSYALGDSGASCSIYFYNNTVNNFATGVSGGLGTIYAKNNIIQGATAGHAWQAATYTSSDYNISNDNTSTGGAHDLKNKTVTFVNAGGNDYLLSPTDTTALDAGEDLHADANLAFNTDVAGIARPQGAAWDIGASESVQAAGNDTQMLLLSTSGVSSTGFTATATFSGDANDNNWAGIYYCDATVNGASCNPLTGFGTAMIRSPGQYTYTATGLVGGDTYNLEVVGVDPDGVEGSPITGTVTLAQPTINIGNLSVNAGSNAAFVVTLNAASSSNVTFNYATSNGTATQPADYTSASASATIAAGQTTLTLPNVATAAGAGGLYFTMTLSSLVGATAGTITGTATLGVVAPTLIYRSAGTKTSALASGGGTVALNSTGAAATFGTALPNNVGVGDAVVYNSGGSIVFISGRTDSTHFALQTAGGAAPTNISGDTSWSIYRAYNSLSNAYTGHSSSNGNGSIPVGVRGFDTFNSNNNLVSANYQWNIALYNDGVDTTAVVMSGWVTSPSSYVRVYTPYLSTDVGVSQRHDGTTSTGYMLSLTASADVMQISDSYVKLDGLIVSSTNIQGFHANIDAYPQVSPGELDISNCIIPMLGTVGSSTSGVATSANSGAVPKLWNNILYSSSASAVAFQVNTAGYFYNNTAVGFGTAFYLSTSGAAFKNNLVQGATTLAFDGSGSCAASSDYNITNDATSCSGVHDKKNVTTVAFAAAGSNDYLLAPTDAQALDAGESLAADPNITFSTDIAGIARPQGAAWDIGASEAVQSAGNDTEMLTLAFSRVYSAGFTATATFSGDNNANNSATIYYCDNTTTPSCSPLGGTSVAMTRSAGQFSTYVPNLLNPGDTYNVEVVAADADGISGSPLIGTVTLLTTPTAIYRSVGYNNTTALATGASNAVTIAGTTATFTIGLPNNVGVGDEIQFQITGTWYYAFISGRTSSTVYTLQNVTGGAPQGASANTSWSIFRAYINAGSSWGASAVCGMNPSLHSNVDGCEGASYDMLANNTQWNFALYADAVEPANVSMRARNTTPTNYIRVYTPYLPTEVGVSQRHSGAWTSSGYIMNATRAGGANAGIQINGDSVVLDGLQITNSVSGADSGAGWSGVSVQMGTYPPNITISNSLIQLVGSATAHTCNGIGFSSMAQGATNILNNIIYSTGVACSQSGFGSGAGPTNYVYNNTIVGFANGIGPTANGVTTLKNNIVQGAASGAYGVCCGASFSAASTNNLSNDNTAPGLNPQKNKTVTFWTTPNGIQSYLLASTDTVAKGMGVSLSADPNVSITTDIVQHSRPATPSIGADEPATAIYRSVGPNNTTALASGTSNAMTISGTTATFAGALPNNVGVGDVIIYASNGQLVFIRGRTSSTSYSVQTNSGGAPTVASGDTSWSIYRAYTSLNKAIKGNTSENSSIVTLVGATLGHFDSGFNNNNNLISNNTQWNIACYADALDSQTSPPSSSWTQGPNNYLRIYAPYLATEVGVSQRHQGVLTSSAYQYVMNTTSDNDGIWLADYTWIDGIQMNYTTTATWSGQVGAIGGNTGEWISNNIIVVNPDANVSTLLAFQIGSADYIWNNIMYYTGSPAAGNAVTFNAVNVNSYVYNNTFVNFLDGITGGGTIVVENNIVQGATAQAYASGVGSGSTNNVANDNSAPGTNPVNNATVAFVNAGASDFLLSPSDTKALDAGVNLSADSNIAFSTDIANIARPQGAAWDIGASEAVQSTGSPTEMLQLTFNNTGTTTFAATATFNGDTNANNSATIYYCDNTASPGCNPLTGSSGTMTRAAGQFTYTATGITVGDAYTVEVVANDPDGVEGSPLTSYDFPQPVLNIGNISVGAGTPAAFVVTLTTASTANIPFSYATANGTATNPTDYTSLSGSTTIPAGQTSLTLPGVTTQVAGAGDYFTMTLSSYAGVWPGTITGAATLTASGATQIFRSVGPGNTSPLACGATGNGTGCNNIGSVTISGNAATFAGALPNNIGVGDAIVYNSNANIAFISGRTSSTVYTLQSASGAAPTAASGDSTWLMYRAYNSLANAIAGNSATNGNPSIAGAVSNFDTFTANNNTVAGNTIWNIACYNDGVDTTSVDTNGWTTGPTNYLRIYAPYAATDVGVSQRHNGSWGSSGYELAPGLGATYALNIQVSSIWVEGLKISFGFATATEAIEFDFHAAGISGTASTYIDNNIINLGTNNNVGIQVKSSTPNLTGSVYIYNNIITQPGTSLGAGISTASNYAANVYVYSNTTVGFEYGYYTQSTANGFILKDNIAQNAGVQNYHCPSTDCAGSNYNVSSDTTSSSGVNDIKSVFVQFLNPAILDYRLSNADLVAKGAGTNLSSDPNLSFTTDIAQNTRTAPWDIGASIASGAMPIYRSVGPTNTTPLACGATGNGAGCSNIGGVTIASGVATFSGALPSNVGVGDALVYNSSATLAFVYQRISSTQFAVRTSTGAAPTAASGDTTWLLYRAYTSFPNAFGATVGTANTSIPAGLKPFDTAATRNLVTSNTQMNFALYADAVESDSAGVTVSGFTTGAANYIRIYTPYATTDVGTSQRHQGVWSNSAFVLSAPAVPANLAALYADKKFIWIDGLQVSVGPAVPTGMAWYGISTSLSSGGASYSAQVSNSIVNVLGTVSDQSGSGIYVMNQGTGTLTTQIWNNIVYGTYLAGGIGSFETGPTSCYIYNNTVVNVYNAIGGCGTTSVLKNNIVQAYTGQAYYGGSYGPASNYNISSGGATGGANDIQFAGVLFSNPGNNDFRLSPADVTAKGQGVNLSSDSYLSFTTDIQGLTRASPWDVGASEVAGGSGPTPIYRSVGPNNTNALACGTTVGACTGTGNMSITAQGLVTFNTAVPNNVGVGDAVQYATTGTTINAIMFVYQRISSTQFIVRTASGAAPGAGNARSNFTAWDVYRAYTSLWQATAGHGFENSAINTAVKGFETFSSGTNNLTSPSTQWNIACYADGQDSAGVAGIDTTWVTSATNYVRVYTPYSASEVGVSQRHNGTWSNSAYALICVTSNGGCLTLQGNTATTFGEWIDGLQIYFSQPGAGGSEAIGHFFTSGSTPKFGRYSNNIFHVDAVDAALAISDSATAASVYEIWNNIFYADAGNTYPAMYISTVGSIANNYIYNNTMVNFQNGIHMWGGSGLTVLKNNIVQSTSTAYSLVGTTTGTDYNLSNHATATGGAHDIINATVQFMDAPNQNFLLAPVDLVAVGKGVNLSVDASLPLTTDINNNTWGTTWDIGASMSAAQPTPIYRSVGPSNTLALANGSGANTLTIATNGMATFSAALPPNIGVGDAIQYASSGSTINSIAFIYQRISSTQYEVRTATGAAPTTCSGEQTWNIFRAYSSMSNAMNGDGFENGSLNATVKSFETFSGYNNNLTSPTKQWNVAMYGDGMETNFDAPQNWTTSSTDYLRIYSPFATSEVGMSQRHSGFWDSSKARATYTNNSVIPLVVNEWVDGIEVLETVNKASAIYSSGMYVNSSTGVTAKISNNLVNFSISNVDVEVFGILVLSNTGGTTYIWNNIVTNLTTTYSNCIGTNADKAYVFNNTVANCNIGISVDPATVLLNNIVQGVPQGWAYQGPFGTGSNYNISSDMTTPGGANDIPNATVTFMNPSNNDYRLSPADATAHGTGEILSQFFTDEKQYIRIPTWDIGADQQISATNNALAFDELTFTSIANTSFSMSLTYSGDYNQNGTATIYTCDATTTPGCMATSGSSVAMTRTVVSHTFAGTVTGLTAGHAINYEIVGVDADGVYGAPISGSLNNGPNISVPANLTVNEGAAASVIVSLSATSTTATTFSWATTNGTATSGTDYTAASGTATIAAGATTTTLPAITILNPGAGVSKYFTVTLSNITGANAGNLVDSVGIFNTTNGMTISGLTTSAVTPSGFAAQISFSGDAAAVGVAVLYYCDVTQSPSCSPLNGANVNMVRGAGVFTATIAGLGAPIAAGDTLNLEVVAGDTGGILGSPLTGSVTLLGTNALTLGALTTSAVSATGFTALATYTGDANNNSSATIAYCDATTTPGCTPSAPNTAMTPGAGVYNISVSGLTTTHTYNISVTGADVNGVANSPLTASVTLASAPNPVGGLQATAVSNSEIDLSWNSGGGTTASYQIAYVPGASYPATCSSGTVLNTSNTSLAVTGLNPSAQYSFLVCALDPALNSSTSQSAQTSTLGTPPTRIFVTSTTYTPDTVGVFDSLAHADLICATRAANATCTINGVTNQPCSLTGTWQALISGTGGGNNAGSRVTLSYGSVAGQQSGNTGVRLLDGTPGGFNGSLVASTLGTGLFTPTTLTNKINRNELYNGTGVSYTVWTGTTSTGTIDASGTNPTCASWGYTGAQTTMYGITNTTNATQWVDKGLNTCNAAFHIYCVDTNPQYHNPPNPTNLAATAGTTNVNLSWTSGLGNTNQFLVVYQAGASAPINCTTGATNVGTATSYNVAGLNSGTQYSFRVCSNDNSNVAFLSPGTTVTATTGQPTINIANTSAVKGSNEKFVVSLTANASANITFNYATADGTAASSTDYTNTNGTATILSGHSSVTLPSVVTASTVTSLARYFTMNISSFTGVNAGNVAGVGTIVDSGTGLQLSGLTTSNITQSSFTANINFVGDSDANAEVSIFVCDNSLISGCNPLNYNGVAMNRGAGQYAATLSGLLQPGDVYNIAVVGSDTGGVTGSPLTGTVTLLSDDAISISQLRLTVNSSSSFTGTIDFSGDIGNVSTVKMWYCDITSNTGCVPTAGSHVTMTRGLGVYTATASSLNTGDTYKVQIVATNTFGVGGSPLMGVVVLTNTGSASQLVITRQPYNPMAVSSEIPLQVTIEDQAGNVITSGADATATITLTLTSGAQTLSGTALSMAAVGGVADFVGLKVNINGIDTNDVITATKSDTSGGGGTTSTTVATNPFNVQTNNSWLGATIASVWMATTGTSVSGGSDGQLNGPGQTFVDAAGNLYVFDSTFKVMKFNSSGVYQGWVGEIGSTAPTGGGSTCTTSTNIMSPAWCTGGSSSGIGWAVGAIWGDATYLYVTFPGEALLARFNLSTGAYSGWVGYYSGSAGTMQNTFTAGCSTTTHAVTPGWCVGGEGSAATLDTNGGMDSPMGIAGDGTYIYVINNSGSNGGIQRYNASTGAALGWIGEIGTVGGGTCGGAVGAFTTGWCTDATAKPQEDGSGTMNGSLFPDGGDPAQPYAAGGFLYVPNNLGTIQQYNTTTGAFTGWIGEVRNTPTGGATGCTSVVAGNATPGWCTGGKAQDTATPTLGIYNEPESVSGDGTNLYILDDSYRVTKVNLSTGAVVGWIGAIGQAVNGACGGINTFTNGWCSVQDTTAVSGPGFGMLSNELWYYPFTNGTSPATGGLFATGSAVYVADAGNNRVTVYNSATGAANGWIGQAATPNTTWQTSGLAGGANTDGMFGYLSGVYTNGTNFYLLDNFRISNYSMANNSYIGWTGYVNAVPTGGASGCTSATSALGASNWSSSIVTPGWCTGGSSLFERGDSGLPEAVSGTVSNFISSVVGDASYMYVASGEQKIDRFDYTGAYQGWIGMIASTTGIGNAVGSAGCTTAGVGAVTPGWCTGGTSTWTATMGGYGGTTQGNGAAGVYADGTYLYIIDNGNGRIDKVTASNGAMVGWVGFVGVTSPSGNGPGVSNCTTTTTGNLTPGWCTGGTSELVTSFNGDGHLGTGVTAITGDGTYIYVAQTDNAAGLVYKFNAATGAFIGWIGAQGANAGTCTAGTGHFTGAWCTGSTVDGANAFEKGGLNYPTGIYTDGFYLYVSEGGNASQAVINKYNAASGAYVGWKGVIGTTPTGGDTNCAGAAVGTFTPGWCTGGAAAYKPTVTGGFNGLQQLYGSGSFIYGADLGNYKLVRIGK